jgi:hypothetical protein
MFKNHMYPTRMPRLTFYKNNIESLKCALQILKPVTMRDDIITLDDLVNASKLSDCLLITVDQLYNNMYSIKKGRGMFRYIEVAGANDDVNVDEMCAYIRYPKEDIPVFKGWKRLFLK